MGQGENPFHWRGSVTDPAAFIGRDPEIQAIFTRLKTLGCVSVVGTRRIGKSSLLYQASSRAGKVLGANCRAVFIDLLSAKHHSLDGLLGAILHGFAGEDVSLPGATATEKLAAFEDAVRAVRSKGIMPVAFLDEFEAIASRTEEFGDNVLESWRSLGNDAQIAFVTSSAQPLDRLTQQSGLTSSFYNIFAQIKLEEFSDKDARAFALYAVRAGNFEMSDETFLLRVGGRHPLKLQVAAWHLYEAKRSGQVDFGVLQQRAQEEISGMMKA
jgi:hypothetical protein